MRDVGEGPAMDEGRSALQRLHQVRHQRLAQTGGHGAVCLEVGRGHGGPVAALGDDKASEARTQIGEIRGKAQYRHHLGRRGDVEPVFAHRAVRRSAQTDHDGAQAAIVEIKAAAPSDPTRVEAERVAMVQVVVDQRGKKVVGAGDGMDVAGEMEVDVLHRRDVCVASARRAAFYPETRAERGFAQAGHRPRAGAAQRVGEPDRGRGLAFSRRGRIDAGDANETVAVHLLWNCIERDFRLQTPVWEDCFSAEAEFGSDVGDWAKAGGAGDGEVGELGHV